MAKKIPVIDTDACIACGNCEVVCPEVFHLNESLGHSEVIDPDGAPGGPYPGCHRSMSGSVHHLGGERGLK